MPVGTVAAAVLLLERETNAPPVGAAPFRVTVPLEDVPPWMLAGFTLMDDSPTGGGGGGLTFVPPPDAQPVTTPTAKIKIPQRRRVRAAPRLNRRRRAHI